MPGEIDITHLRGKGCQAGEEELPEEGEEQPGKIQGKGDKQREGKEEPGDICCGKRGQDEQGHAICWRVKKYCSFIFHLDVQIDDGVVSHLMDMGFPLEACKKAVFNTNNQGVEPAMNWVMEHMGDPGKATIEKVQSSVARRCAN